MATTLIAAAIALLFAHYLPEAARFRLFGWLKAWLEVAANLLGGAGLWRHPLGGLLAIALPTLAALALLWWIGDAGFGLWRLLIAIVALFYCWGPRDLDLDVAAIAAAPDPQRRRAAAVALIGREPEGLLAGGLLVDALMHAALARWFGTLFWFAVGGPAGALAYRLTWLLARDPEWRGTRPEEQDAALQKLMGLLDWPAAQLMTLALAVAADFDAVATAWREFHAPRGGIFGLDLGFLNAAARASVDCDEQPIDERADGTPGAIGELQQALALCWRILVVWGVVFALLVLAGHIG